MSTGADQRPFPFIVGSSRSGKTLLKAMLDAHPDMAVLMETHFVAWMARHRHRYQGPDGFRSDVFVRDLLGRSALRNLGLESQDVESLAASGRMLDLATAIRELFALSARRLGKSRYGNRTVSHVLSMPSIASLLPEARFIHVIRDGRNVALALVDARFGPNTVAGAAMRWKRSVTRGREDGRTLGPLRYGEVRYEALIQDPERVVRAVCEFVGLNYHPRMLRYYEHVAEIRGVNLDHPDFAHLRLPPTEGLQDWRTEMDGEDLLLFETLAGKTLTRFGYPLSGARWPPSSRLRARSRAWAARGEFVWRAVRKRLRRVGRLGKKSAATSPLHTSVLPA